MAVQQGSWSQTDKADWQRQRLADELARGIHSATGPVARFLANKPPTKSEKRSFDQLNEKLNRELTKAVNDAIKEKTAPTLDDIEAAAASGKRLHFDGKSTCFSELSWQDGVVDAVFTNGYAYSAPLDLDTFIDWMSDDSVGSYFNDALGRDFFAATKGKGG